MILPILVVPLFFLRISISRDILPTYPAVAAIIGIMLPGCEVAPEVSVGLDVVQILTVHLQDQNLPDRHPDPNNSRGHPPRRADVAPPNKWRVASWEMRKAQKTF